MDLKIQIDNMRPVDSAQVLEIYGMGIASGQATFETEIPDWETWDANHLKVCRLVARSGMTLLGWAALSPISKRKAYAGVAEVSIYIHPDHQGKGIGKALLNELVQCSEATGFWTLQSNTFTSNTASIAIQKQCGFRVVGQRERIAKLNGTWQDTVLMERRSNITGVK